MSQDAASFRTLHEGHFESIGCHGSHLYEGIAAKSRAVGQFSKQGSSNQGFHTTKVTLLPVTNNSFYAGYCGLMDSAQLWKPSSWVQIPVVATCFFWAFFSFQFFLLLLLLLLLSSLCELSLTKPVGL